MAEQEFAETMEMIIYIVLLALVLGFAGFLSYVGVKVADTSRYMGSSTAFALYLLKGSELVYHDLSGNPVPYVVNYTALEKSIEEKKFYDPHLQIIFNVITDDGQVLQMVKLGRPLEKVDKKITYPVMFYFESPPRYARGFVEVYVGASNAK